MKNKLALPQNAPERNDLHAGGRHYLLSVFTISVMTATSSTNFIFGTKLEAVYPYMWAKALNSEN